MDLYNLMTCEGFQVFSQSALENGKPYDCNLAWTFCIFVLIGILLSIFVLRRQCQDGIMAGVNYNVWGALVLGLGLSILVATLTGEARWVLLSGIIGIAIGGFGIGYFADSNSGADSGGGGGESG